MGELTRGFLEEAWTLARKELPGWAYASLLASARAKAGGKASGREIYPGAMDKIALATFDAEALSKLTAGEITSVWLNLNRWHKSAKKKGIELTVDLIPAARRTVRELKKRNISPTPGPLLSKLEKETESETPNSLEDLFKWSSDGPLTIAPILKGAPPEALPEKEVRDLPQLRAAVRWAFNSEGSTGFHATTPKRAATFKQRTELNVVAIAKIQNKNGLFNYFGGVRPNGLDCDNITKFEGADFVNLGGSLNTDIDAEVGSILKVSVLEMNADTEENTFSWLGARILGVEKDEGLSYTAEQCADIEVRSRAIKREVELVTTSGRCGASVAFVGATPSSLELMRGEPFVGPARGVFESQYIAPLGLTRDDVILTHVCPESVDLKKEFTKVDEWASWLEKELDELKPRIVVALGKDAKEALGDRADFSLPHPTAVFKFGDSGEVGRKVKRIVDFLGSAEKSDENSFDGKTKKGDYLDSRPRIGSTRKGQIENPDSQKLEKEDANLADVTREQRSKDLITVDGQSVDTGSGETSSEMIVPITKADPEKQIVYGVVLDPYGKNGAQEDAHLDWPTPAGVESSAHAFMLGPRTIGIQHKDKANAVLVESWIPQYPSDDDRAKAMREEPHKVFRQKFGDDVIHSGSWVAGVKLGDAEWASYMKGDLNAFSPGGAAVRNPISREELPEITFVDLVAKA